MAAQLAPIQLGFGVKQGTEAAAHAARRFLRDLQPGQALLKPDFVNAFNTISKEILQTLREEYLSSTHSSQSVTAHHLVSVFLLISNQF